MDIPGDREPSKRFEVNINAIQRVQAGMETMHEHIDLPFGLRNAWVRRFYVWLTGYYSRHNTLSVLIFVVSFVITALLLPLTVSGPIGIVVGAVLSFVLALVSPVAVLITRNTSHYQ